MAISVSYLLVFIKHSYKAALDFQNHYLTLLILQEYISRCILEKDRKSSNVEL